MLPTKMIKRLMSSCNITKLCDVTNKHLASIPKIINDHRRKIRRDIISAQQRFSSVQQRHTESINHYNDVLHCLNRREVDMTLKYNRLSKLYQLTKDHGIKVSKRACYLASECTLEDIRGSGESTIIKEFAEELLKGQFGYLGHDNALMEWTSAIDRL